jgi:hypothetical protein
MIRKVKEIVEKELLVTIVLDCCFSGGMVRNHDSDDFNIRYLEWDAITHHSPEQDSENMSSPCSDTFRDGSTELAWLVEPKGYMVFAAYSPEERAFELIFKG